MGRLVGARAPSPLSVSAPLAHSWCTTESSMASTECSQSRAIPSRRVILSEAAQLPHDYSSTPGGTLFSTTPGGTRIIYDRKFLMECRKSPVTKTPPRDLPNIPGVTSPSTEEPKPEANNTSQHGEKVTHGDESLFEMDI